MLPAAIYNNESNKVRGDILDFNIKINKILKQQDLTLVELAEIIGTSPSTLYNFSSRGKITLDKLLKIAYVLDYHVEDIIDIKEEEKKRLESKLWEVSDDK